MTDLLTRHQLLMLARTLRTDPANLESMARLGAQNLRVLRERLSGLLFDADEPVFARLSKLSPLVPDTLLTKITVAAVPPEVGGRAGGSLGLAHPERVAHVLSTLPPTYLADAAPHLDPRTVAALAPLLSGGMLIPTATELLARRDYTTAGKFVEHATDALIDDFAQGLSDDVGLLCAVAVVPDADKLDQVVSRLSPARRDALFRAAATDTDAAVLAVLSVLARLGAENRARATAALIDSLDDAALRRLTGVAAEQHALGELLTALSGTPATTRSRVAATIAKDADQLDAVVTAAATSPEVEDMLQAIRAQHS
ncbi:hypothetical protein NN3_13050 [Nocardia neocaledoniensis NBRC 108232]|uniref:Uncharacterized protein n=1 Tax=Nocardia neocaledoniensis TaxID=236511 RepID=A0A317N6V4_9NOCA|nr:hypothetical protein [Nocardia neocaledoniensis]PWV71036.1 hypothetical protein DFR69_11125 [Nocardia neocaledoniensis]GEM30298.1 hypothetical protein NN3_13050 [Nocardia neocaledoniensis NBRC 108232]